MSRKNKGDDEKLAELHAMASELLNHSHGTGVSGTTSLRESARISGGYDFADTLHNIYLDFGYPAQLEFRNFWNMYRRFGIATNVVELPVDTGWVTTPTFEAPPEFINAFDKLNDRIKLWTRIKGLDTRQRVGRYAGIFMRIRDGLDPSKPIEGVVSGDAALVDAVPLYESQLEVIESDQDPRSDNFGQPILLQYRQSVAGNRNEETHSTISIHVSRIVFAAEGADDGWIYGIPALEPIYNSLMDLRKIIGGGGEGFYKNASQNIIFDLKEGFSSIALKEKLEKFNEQYDEFSRNRFRRAMWTPGMESKTLDSQLISPKDFFDVAINDVAAGSQIPATILVGKQTGRLASNEDSRQFLSVVQSRRENFMTVLTRGVIDWLIDHGVLPSAEYMLIWDDLLARSDSEKLDNSKKMVDVNKSQFESGGDTVFTGEEIREAAGFEPLEEIIPTGEDGSQE